MTHVFKAAYIDNKFWYKNTIRVPDKAPPVEDFLELENIIHDTALLNGWRIDWGEYEISGVVILPGEWNYCLIDDKYYHLIKTEQYRVIKNGTKNEQCWYYYFEYDDWTNDWLKGNVYLKGTISKTGDEALVANNIHQTTPLITGGNDNVTFNKVTRPENPANIKISGIEDYETYKECSTPFLNPDTFKEYNDYLNQEAYNKGEWPEDKLVFPAILTVGRAIGHKESLALELVKWAKSKELHLFNGDRTLVDFALFQAKWQVGEVYTIAEQKYNNIYIISHSVANNKKLGKISIENLKTIQYIGSDYNELEHDEDELSSLVNSWAECYRDGFSTDDYNYLKEQMIISSVYEIHQEFKDVFFKCDLIQDQIKHGYRVVESSNLLKNVEVRLDQKNLKWKESENSNEQSENHWSSYLDDFVISHKRFARNFVNHRNYSLKDYLYVVGRIGEAKLDPEQELTLGSTTRKIKDWWIESDPSTMNSFYRYLEQQWVEGHRYFRLKRPFKDLPSGSIGAVIDLTTHSLFLGEQPIYLENDFLSIIPDYEERKYVYAGGTYAELLEGAYYEKNGQYLFPATTIIATESPNKIKSSWDFLRPPTDAILGETLPTSNRYAPLTYSTILNKNYNLYPFSYGYSGISTAQGLYYYDRKVLRPNIYLQIPLNTGLDFIEDIFKYAKDQKHKWDTRDESATRYSYVSGQDFKPVIAIKYLVDEITKLKNKWEDFDTYKWLSDYKVKRVNKNYSNIIEECEDHDHPNYGDMAIVAINLNHAAYFLKQGQLVRNYIFGRWDGSYNGLIPTDIQQTSYSDGSNLWHVIYAKPYNRKWWLLDFITANKIAEDRYDQGDGKTYIWAKKNNQYIYWNIKTDFYAHYSDESFKWNANYGEGALMALSHLGLMGLGDLDFIKLNESNTSASTNTYTLTEVNNMSNIYRSRNIPEPWNYWYDHTQKYREQFKSLRWFLKNKSQLATFGSYASRRYDIAKHLASDPDSPFYQSNSLIMDGWRKLKLPRYFTKFIERSYNQSKFHNYKYSGTRNVESALRDFVDKLQRTLRNAKTQMALSSFRFNIPGTNFIGFAKLVNNQFDFELLIKALQDTVKDSTKENTEFINASKQDRDNVVQRINSRWDLCCWGQMIPLKTRYSLTKDRINIGLSIQPQKDPHQTGTCEFFAIEICNSEGQETIRQIIEVPKEINLLTSLSDIDRERIVRQVAYNTYERNIEKANYDLEVAKFQEETDIERARLNLGFIGTVGSSLQKGVSAISSGAMAGLASKSSVGGYIGAGAGIVSGLGLTGLDIYTNWANYDINKRATMLRITNGMQAMQLKGDSLRAKELNGQEIDILDIRRMQSNIVLPSNSSTLIHKHFNALNGLTNIYLVCHFPTGKLLKFLEDYYNEYGFDIFIRDFEVHGIAQIHKHLRFSDIEINLYHNETIRGMIEERALTGIKVIEV